MSTKTCRCFPSMHMCVQQYLCPNLLGRKRRKQPNMLMANRNQHGKATHNQPMTQHANNTTNTDFPPSVSHAHRHAPSHMYSTCASNKTCHTMRQLTNITVLKLHPKQPSVTSSQHVNPQQHMCKHARQPCQRHNCHQRFVLLKSLPDERCHVQANKRKKA